MNKKIAIKGHLSRGDEVIKILEMLGGKISNECEYIDGYDNSYIFFIDTDENFYIDGLFLCNNEELKKYHIFTLEEFLENFPYKVGDKVQHNGATFRGSVYVIEQMKWEDNQIKYVICDLYWKNCKSTVASKDLQPYKEETMEERENSVVVNIENKQLKVNSLRFDKTQLVINDEYELKQERDAYYIVRKKLQYPKTYKESCDILGIDTLYNDARGYKDFLMVQFQELIISRDAYWKIIGKQMGLDEPWKPDWKDSNFKYCLKKMGDNIEKTSEMTISCILAFPTEEILNIFYNNFKSTIEQCKELL